MALSLFFIMNIKSKKIRHVSIGYDASLKLEDLADNQGRKGGYTRLWFTPDYGYELVVIKDNKVILKGSDFDVIHVQPKQYSKST